MAKKRLTARERRLFKALAEGKNQTEAAIEAGYSTKHPRQSAHQAVKNIENKAPDLFARHGLDDDSFIDKHILPALNAEETKFFAHEGIVTDQRNVIAWGPRIQMNGLVARMKGMVIENREAAETKIGIQVILVPSGHRPVEEATNPANAPT